ncbi:MAG: CBS domain-containing protein [Chitinophagales bacterium]
MDIITSHNSLDFDGLAAMIAAGKLYPSAVIVCSGTLSKNVKQFMGLYKDSLNIRMPGEININEIKRVIVVDTNNVNRLGLLKGLGELDVEYFVYDHHPTSEDDIVGTIHEVHKVGAATTILVELIKKADLSISPFEATILALGVYEDTGSLLFSSTTARDAAAVAYLLEKGANLGVINNFMDSPFSNDQRMLMQRLIASVRRIEIHGMKVVLATSEETGFTPGLDSVVYHLSEVEVCDAIFVVAVMQGKTHVVARSATANIMVDEILAPLGGKGHEKAASVVVKGKSLEVITGIISEMLMEKVRPAQVAKDIMSTPVKSIPMHFSMEQAGRLLLRYGHTGIPVVDEDKMVGVISRRDVDKARMHNLGHAPVKGFMTREVIHVSPDTPVSEIQRIIVERDIGRLPVLENGLLVGIVSRTDVLRTLHGDDYPEDHAILYPGPEGDMVYNYRGLMEARLPKRIEEVLQIAGNIASQLGSNVYSVGGFVRDLFLGVPNFDVDLVVEGDGPELAQHLAEALGGRARVHERFKTAVVILNDGLKIDVATSRTEFYEFPAALPKVERSSIREDLYRRDFTVNTMAICLNTERFGELIDYFGGQRDLRDGWIRILYNLSFVEDPTRIIRAVRFEQRYKFKIEPDTLRLAQDAINRRLLKELSYKRIQQELILILEEKDPVPALKRMDEIGVWPYIIPEVTLDEGLRLTLRRIPRVLGWIKEREMHLAVESWVIYLEVLFSGLEGSILNNILDRFQFNRNSVRIILKARDIPELADRLESMADSKMSYLDELLESLAPENIAYLLLCIEKEETWDLVTRYLEIRANCKVELNGHDLRRIGIKPGPVYQLIFSRLKSARLDGEIVSYQEELDMVTKWIEGGVLDG